MNHDKHPRNHLTVQQTSLREEPAECTESSHGLGQVSSRARGKRDVGSGANVTRR